MVRVVEGACEEPETVDGAADLVSLFVSQEATVFEVGLPFFERV